jgi:NADPH:quinone reductase-like Zn-dependent oxidoreductase
MPAPLPATGEVVVSLRAAALNHRDVWIKLGQYPGSSFPASPVPTGLAWFPRWGPGLIRPGSGVR